MSDFGPPTVEQPFTKTEHALRILRMRIAGGDLEPGQRLTIRQLTEELAMSPTPVREALRLLQADGLVAHRPHHGMVVAAQSEEQIRDIYEMRKVLEPLAAERATWRMTDEQRATLEERHAELLVAANAKGDKAAAVAANARWHWALYEACGSERLLSFIQRLWDVAPWRTAWVVRRRPELLNEQHLDLHAAVMARDAPLARRLMLAHLEFGEETLLETMRESTSESLAAAQGAGASPIAIARDGA